jgi:plasmid stability protein
MAAFSIPDLPKETWQRLQVRAWQHGRSLEDEACAILTEAVQPPPATLTAAALQAHVRDLYGGQLPQNVTDEFIAERRRAAALE